MHSMRELDTSLSERCTFGRRPWHTISVCSSLYVSNMVSLVLFCSSRNKKIAVIFVQNHNVIITYLGWRLQVNGPSDICTPPHYFINGSIQKSCTQIFSSCFLNGTYFRLCLFCLLFGIFCGPCKLVLLLQIPHCSVN